MTGREYPHFNVGSRLWPRPGILHIHKPFVFSDLRFQIGKLKRNVLNLMSVTFGVRDQCLDIWFIVGYFNFKFNSTLISVQLKCLTWVLFCVSSRHVMQIKLHTLPTQLLKEMSTVYFQ